MSWIAPAIALLLGAELIRRLFLMGVGERGLPRIAVGLVTIALLTVTMAAQDHHLTQAVLVLALGLLLFAVIRMGELTERLGLYRQRVGELSRALESASESTSSAIESSERRLRELARAAPVGIFEADGHGALTWVSERWRRITGHERGDGRRPSLVAGVHPEDRPEIERALARAFDQKTRFEDVFRYVHSDGQEVWVAMVAVPLERGLGEHGFVGTVLDVSEQREREREREFLRLRVERAERLEGLGLLAGGVAHDLNNMLVPILGHGEKLERQLQPGSPASQSCAEILRSARRAADLAARMLNYGGGDEGRRRPVDLRQLLREVVTETTAQCRCAIHCELEEGDFVLRGDGDRIADALRNVLINAVEAMDGRDGAIRVRLGLTVLGEADLRDLDEGHDALPGAYVMIEVRDEGPGFAPEILERAFHPFVSSKFRGRGLGLLAVSGLARAMRGGIVLESRPGAGATLRLFLPLEDEPGREETESSRIQSGTFLVADDQAEVRGLIREALEERGLEVIEAADGLQAQQRIEAEDGRFSALLLDLSMPVMSGEELFDWLGTRSPGLPVLILSGFGESETLRRLRASGRPVAFLRKPFGNAELMEVLDRLLAAGPAG